MSADGIVLCVQSVGDVCIGGVAERKITLNNLPAYSGEAYVELNDNVPSFSKKDMTSKAFEKYSELDDLGRCGTAYANVCRETMPTEERGNIG